MEFWHGFLLITGIHLLAAASPGPDFIFVSQQTLSRGRMAGLVCALGVALGLGIHIAYSVFGMAVLIAQAAWLLTAIKIIGGIRRVDDGFAVCVVCRGGLPAFHPRRQ